MLMNYCYFLEAQMKCLASCKSEVSKQSCPISTAHQTPQADFWFSWRLRIYTTNNSHASGHVQSGNEQLCMNRREWGCNKNISCKGICEGKWEESSACKRRTKPVSLQTPLFSKIPHRKGPEIQNITEKIFQSVWRSTPRVLRGHQEVHRDKESWPPCRAWASISEDADEGTVLVPSSKHLQ